ncbi:hypothetical protein KY347_01335 [Candidatus Woesearchaeota archaeon]|nr:hypothetical protein [Candidatus Woesearchaeota archaeon]
MEDEKVKRLAETLKSQGLAASMFEAIQKAKSILNVGAPKGDDPEGKNEERFKSPDYDIGREDATLNELMEDVGVTEEQVESKKQEKLDEMEIQLAKLKKGIEQAEKSPEKTEQIREDISSIKDEIEELGEGKKEEEPAAEEDEPEDDKFKEEKKIDLTKVFGPKK